MVKKKSGHRRRENRLKEEKYIAPYSPEILSMSVEGLGLSDVTLAVLKAGKIFSVGDIAVRREREMYRIQNFGKRNLLEVSAKLRSLGVELRPERSQDEGAVSSFYSNKRGDAKVVTNTRKRREVVTRGFKEQHNTQQVNKQQVSSVSGARSGDERRQSRKSGRKWDNIYSSARLFPRAPFVASPPEHMTKDIFSKMQRAGKWGFKDALGKEVIPAIYDEVFAFKEDMACVEKNGLFGYINRKNELVIPYRYLCAASFQEGLACVVLEEKCGFIDQNGDIVLPLEYDAATAFDDGISRAKKDGKWGLLKKDGSFNTL